MDQIQEFILTVNPEEYVWEMNPEILHKIGDLLLKEDRWEKLVNIIGANETRFKLEDLSMRQARNAGNDTFHSSLIVLRALSVKGFKVKHLALFLNLLQMEDCLLVIRDPESLQIITQPQGTLNITEGSPIELSVEATGFPYPRYQWFKITDRKKIKLDHLRSSCCYIKEASINDSGKYLCGITNKGNKEAIFSNYCLVDVSPGRFHGNTRAAMYNNAVKVILQPGNVKVEERSIFTLKTRVTPGSHVNYQWYYNGNKLNIAGSASSDLVIKCAQKNHNGNYQCMISDSKGNIIMTRVASVEVTSPSTHTAVDKVALLIGNYEYKMKGNLPAVINDVKLLGDHLKYLGFRVIILTNLTAGEINTYVLEFTKLLNEGVYGIFYFGGHGCLLPNNETYLMGYDAHEKFNLEDCVGVQDILGKLQYSAPKLILILIDACRQQQNYEEAVAVRLPDVKNSIKLFATTPYEEAYEEKAKSKQQKSYSIFMSIFKDVVLEKMDVIDLFKRVAERMSVQRPHVEMAVQPGMSLHDQIFYENFTSVYQKNIWHMETINAIPPNLKITLENIPLSIKYKAVVNNVLRLTVNVHHFNANGELLTPSHVRIRDIKLQQLPLDVDAADRRNSGGPDLFSFEILNLHRLQCKLEPELVISFENIRNGYIKMKKLQLLMDWPLISQLNKLQLFGKEAVEEGFYL